MRDVAKKDAATGTKAVRSKWRESYVTTVATKTSFFGIYPSSAGVFLLLQSC